MKPLRRVIPTAEQFKVVDNPDPGFWLIRGAAGSGKTTTALLRLKFLVDYWHTRRLNLGLEDPVRVLVLTFNRTLRGYITELVHAEVEDYDDVELEVSTFGSWSLGRTTPRILDHRPQRAQLENLGAGKFNWDNDFLVAEVNYALGRFLPADLPNYVKRERSGRGRSPRVDGDARRRLLDEIIAPYEQWKHDQGVVDWNDVAVQLALEEPRDRYDIVIADEAQDFSANQIRAIVNHLETDFSCTFVRDTVQRIYDNAFIWRDVEVEIPAAHSRKLEVNYRNTSQIAALARPLVEGIEQQEDESIPDFTTCSADGPKPVVLRGTYSRQLDWAIDYLRNSVGADESVGCLHPKGGGWFSTLRSRLDAEKIPWTNLTREVDWPDGPELVALSTMHSAKGLEFDHVLVLGYNKEVVEHGEEDGDWMVDKQRRLLAMSIGRARKSVVLGYKPTDESPLIDFLDDQTFDAIDV